MYTFTEDPNVSTLPVQSGIPGAPGELSVWEIPDQRDSTQVNNQDSTQVSSQESVYADSIAFMDSIRNQPRVKMPDHYKRLDSTYRGAPLYLNTDTNRTFIFYQDAEKNAREAKQALARFRSKRKRNNSKPVQQPQKEKQVVKNLDEVTQQSTNNQTVLSDLSNVPKLTQEDVERQTNLPSESIDPEYPVKDAEDAKRLIEKKEREREREYYSDYRYERALPDPAYDNGFMGRMYTPLAVGKYWTQDLVYDMRGTPESQRSTYHAVQRDDPEYYAMKEELARKQFLYDLQNNPQRLLKQVQDANLQSSYGTIKEMDPELAKLKNSFMGQYVYRPLFREVMPTVRFIQDYATLSANRVDGFSATPINRSVGTSLSRIINGGNSRLSRGVRQFVGNGLLWGAGEMGDDLLYSGLDRLSKDAYGVPFNEAVAAVGDLDPNYTRYALPDLVNFHTVQTMPPNGVVVNLGASHHGSNLVIPTRRPAVVSLRSKSSLLSPVLQLNPNPNFVTRNAGMVATYPATVLSGNQQNNP